MEFKDYYKLLGVARDADAGQIKQAFRRLARKHHPDVNKAADAGARMAEVNEAYAVLSDAERRAAYDALGQRRRDGETFTPPPEWERDFEFDGAGFDSAQARDFSDFFANLSGRARKGGAGRARPGWDGAGGAGSASGEYRARGQDLHARIELRIEDAFHAIERQITLQQPVLGDDGRVELKTRTLEVKIPRGVRPGQLIRLAGQGGPGIGGEPAGDVLLEVAFVPDARFRVEGKRLLADVALAPWEAALGTVLPVTLPDGSTLKVRVPEGAQDGTVLTVRGKGLPGATPGDLELTVCVILPSAMAPRARRAYEQMASELPDFDARKVWAAERERNSSNEEAR